VVFIKAGALEISAPINRDQRLIDKAYKPAPTTYASSLLAILGSYINKLIS
jgi:hypothetical protein